jgi:hypothetical protein
LPTFIAWLLWSRDLILQMNARQALPSSLEVEHTTANSCLESFDCVFEFDRNQWSEALIFAATT